jgi:hypothetical protein
MPNIDVKDAVRRAVEYTGQLYAPEAVRNLRFEEVELSDDGCWYITVGFDRAEPANPHPLMAAAALFPAYRREYKVVKIDSNTGDVKALKMRQPA